MSFQAYLDKVEEKTGKTPRQFVDLARSKGFDDPGVKSMEVVKWLKEEFAIGHGHAMAMVHVIKKGPAISAKHVGTEGTHRDDSDTLYLEGIAKRDEERAARTATDGG